MTSITLERPALRSLTDDEIAAAVATGTVDLDAAVAEMTRRDRSARARAAARNRNVEWEAAAYAQYEAAEARCRGNMLSEAGKRAGRDAWPMLWQGGETAARKLASEELLCFWDYESPRVPGPAVFAAGQRAERDALAPVEPGPAPWVFVPGGRVRLTSVRVSGAPREAWWSVDEAGRAVLHATREAAVESLTPVPVPVLAPVPAMSPASVSRFEAALSVYSTAIGNLTARALAAHDRIGRRQPHGQLA